MKTFRYVTISWLVTLKDLAIQLQTSISYAQISLFLAFVDFTLITRFLGLSPNASRACATVSIQDDRIAEGTESFSLSLLSSSNNVELTRPNIQISIEDNDSELD